MGQCRVITHCQCRSHVHAVMGAGEAGIGGRWAGGSAGEEAPLTPTHPHPPDRAVPHTI